MFIREKYRAIVIVVANGSFNICKVNIENIRILVNEAYSVNDYNFSH